MSRFKGRGRVRAEVPGTRKKSLVFALRRTGVTSGRGPSRSKRSNERNFIRTKGNHISGKNCVRKRHLAGQDVCYEDEEVEED